MTDEMESLRRLGFSIAYRMLGSVTDAEEVVQEAFLRFYAAQQEGTVPQSPKSYFASVVTRLAIDTLRSARVRRETYVGTWLPEPLVNDQVPEPARQVELAESLSMAFMTILETLSPVERAVFLLREAFDYEYAEIAAIVEKNEENCRQILARAKKHLDAGKPRFEPSHNQRDAVARRFFDACREGNIEDFVNVLAEDVTFYGDGGGRVKAVIQPVLGRDRVFRLLKGFFTKGAEVGIHFRTVDVNGDPGAMVLDREDRLVNVVVLEIAGGEIVAIRSVANPDKLRHLGELSDITRLRR